MNSLIIDGEIKNCVPFFNANLDKNGKLVIIEKGEFSLTVDTGFSGGIALPLDILEAMNVKLAFYDTFKLATGEIVDLPVFIGKVIIRNSDIETWFIPGDSLLGMEFLSSVGSLLSFDFKKKNVKLLE